jgi:trehalose 6-phosphate synthase
MNRLVVVSNRVPAPNAPGGQAGGLAVALEGLMAKRGGVWFGWSGRISASAATAPATVTQADKVAFATIDLTQEEHDRYYSNFSNGLLWPLLHTMPELMAYDRRDAQVYRAVNARIADALLPSLRPDDLIWVHDYHLLPLPALLRARTVRNPIGFFLHIPFPGPDVLATVPDMAALIRDLTAADLIGFQTDKDLENFVAAAQTLAGALGYGDGWLSMPGRRVRLGVFPVEIEPHEFAAIAGEAWRGQSTQRLRHSLHGQRLILGVDRLDPTKGLLQRFAAYRKLLQTRPEWCRQVTMLQIAPVSRKEVTPYRTLRAQLDREAGAINSEFGAADWTPLRIVARAGARNVLAGYMREARVGFVTPLRDGMNLVAKEYVAAQNPADPGVLVLSPFAGAARQLEAALMVNPHDPDAMADALDTALRMSLGERQERWQALWQAIEHASPVGWGRSFLAALFRAVLAADEPAASRGRVRLERTPEGLALARRSTIDPARAGALPPRPSPRQIN